MKLIAIIYLSLAARAFALEPFAIEQLQGRVGKLSFAVNGEFSEAGECKLSLFADSVQIQTSNQEAISYFQNGHLNSFYLNTAALKHRQAIMSFSRLPDGAMELCGIYGRARNIHRYLLIDSKTLELRLHFNCGAMGLGEETRLTSRCEF
jgi:hypothetical protein